MANYPSAIDDASSLYSPADAFSTKPLNTTATQLILAGDSTVSVASTDGFAATYGILSINDELIIYTAKNATQFTGCQRGAFGTSAAQHSSGVAVKANMVSGFLTALQSAVLAIENEIGVTSARNYVRKDGAVTITGLKTFVDGAEFGAGAKAATGLVRLPNDGALRWRKADNSGDLGMSLNAANHVAMEAIMDFATGQTFGAFSYPDATTGSKGIVQIDAGGGLAVAAGVLSLANTAVTPGTYPKVTVDTKGRVTAGASLAASDLPTHTHVAGDIGSGAFGVNRGGTGMTTVAANKLLYSPSQDTLAELSVGSGLSLAAGVISLGIHTHPATDIVSGSLALARGGSGADLSATGPGFLRQASAGAAVTVAALSSGDVTGALGYTPANKAGDTFTGTLHVAGDQAFVECGSYQTVGGAFENMAKYSEDFSVATWDKNGGSCSVTANSTAAPDGNTTADTVTASTATPIIQQQIAGLMDGGTYTFYVWAKVASGTRKVSLAIVNNAYGSYLAGPTQVTLTSAWQRFRITGALASGQTGLWIVVRQYDSNGDNWTTGSIYLWGACLQQGNDPKAGYARTWASQTALVAAGVACGTVVISGKDNAESPLRVYGPGSNLADHTLLEVTAGGELIIAGGTGNGYRLAELMGANNPSGWAGVLKVKTPSGTTLGHILLYTNP
ncbi:MAG: carbohydrate binding domain-containing protein [Acidobacteria bacterium]|nr:carbohydrate binding domain-containing protein [Acidobacteriota bacterium]